MNFKFFLAITALLSLYSGYSQEVQLLSNFNNKSYRFTSIIEKDINNKWDYFSLTEVGAQYNETDKISFESNHFANYKLQNGLALTTGIGVQNNNFLTQIGVSLAKEQKKWSYAFFPTLYYGIADKQFGASLNSYIEFSPAINEQWNFFNLFLFDFDYDFADAIQSQQYLNVGLEYNNKVHFGVNLDLEQSNNYKENDIEFGLFLGINL